MIKTNLDKLNSATKYPSILTYHELGDKGTLVNNVQVRFNNSDMLVTKYPSIFGESSANANDTVLTEKIDGTNARIILFGADKSYFIGSREELLAASGDLLYNPSMGIVDVLRPLIPAIQATDLVSNVWIFFGEVYGAKINNAKNYTSCHASGFRLFDIAYYDSEYDLNNFLTGNSIQSISSFREQGRQKFLNETQFQDIARRTNLPIVPRLGDPHAVHYPPSDVMETFAWLKTMLPGKTHAPIDGEGGKPEGIVIRTRDRSKIAKIRFEDYEKTHRHLNKLASDIRQTRI